MMRMVQYNIFTLIMYVIVKESSGKTRCGTYKETGKCPNYYSEPRYYALVKDPIKLLLEDGGKWYLAAGGSNAPDAPPPSKTCVNVTVTDTGNYSECIFNTFNHTVHHAPVIKVVGFDDDDYREIFSVGPVHAYPPQGMKFYATHNDYMYEKNFMYQNSMIKSTTCWHPETQIFNPYRFVIRNPFLWYYTIEAPHESQYLYLIGINARMPQSEIHVALLAKTKTYQRDISYATIAVDTSNNGSCDIAIDVVGDLLYMPKLQLKCAKDYIPPKPKKKKG